MKQLLFKKRKQIWLAVTVMLISTSCSRQKESHQTGEYQFKIHQFASPAAGIFSNAYYIELQNSVVVVDATLINTTSLALKNKIDSLGKPIAAVLLTHGHPDHYNGLGNVVGTSHIPIYSTQEVLDVIKEYDVAKEEQWTPMFGAEWPTNRIFPSTVVNDGEILRIDGVEFSVHKLGPGESHADSYWILKADDKRCAFIGDAVLHGVHAYMTDGHFVEWLENLTKLEESLRNVQMIYPGHGEPGSHEMLKWQRDYIGMYIYNVNDLLGNKDRLSEEDKAELVTRMKEVLSNDKLEFLIGLGADVVAAGIRDMKNKGQFDDFKNLLR